MIRMIIAVTTCTSQSQVSWWRSILACFQILDCCSARNGTLRAASTKWARKTRPISGPPTWAMPVSSKKAAMAFIVPAPKITLATRTMCIHINRIRPAPVSICSQSRTAEDRVGIWT